MDEEKTIREHMLELKKLFIRLVIPLILLFALFFWASSYLMDWLINYMGLNPNQLVALNPFENLYARATIATSLSIFFGIPIIFTGIYSYVRPVITEHHRGLLVVIAISSLLLGIIGALVGVLVFSKFVLLMLSTSYLLVEPMWGITSVLRYMIMMALTLAFILQISLVIPLLVRYELLTIRDVTEHRVGVFIVVMILSALLSPPDPFSMFLMIIPIYGSYELGVLIAKLTRKKGKNI